MQQDSNTTQATDRAETDALSFGAKKIAIMIGVGLIAGSLHCLCWWPCRWRSWSTCVSAVSSIRLAHNRPYGNPRTQV